MSIYKPTYLYIKQHNVTGLKYFGKTAHKDPYKYLGSGKYWRRHLAKHGKYVTTVWCQLFEHEQELVNYALKFSKENNIVESEEWANLCVETGLDGSHLSESSIKQMVNTRKSKGSYIRTNESVTKAMETRKANGTVKTATPESIAKSVETKKKLGKLDPNTPESIAKGLATKRKNGTLYCATPESKQKMLDTKKANGTMNSNTPESIAKRLETRKKNGTNVKVPCEFCSKQVAKYKMSQHLHYCKSAKVHDGGQQVCGSSGS